MTQQTEPTADQALRERITTTLSAAGAFCGNCGFQPGDRGCPDCERCWADYAAALLPLFAEEVRAGADEIDADNDCSCSPRYTCPLCRATDRLRARADAIHPAANPAPAGPVAAADLPGVAS